MILDDDDLEAICQNSALNDFFELGALGHEDARRDKTRHCQNGQSGAPAVASVSL
jgi:hypothetical protein